MRQQGQRSSVGFISLLVVQIVITINSRCSKICCSRQGAPSPELLRNRRHVADAKVAACGQCVKGRPMKYAGVFVRVLKQAHERAIHTRAGRQMCLDDMLRNTHEKTPKRRNADASA
jgi:hypothetical protein